MNRELPERQYQRASPFDHKNFNERGLNEDFRGEYLTLQSYAQSNRTDEQFLARLADLKQRQGFLLKTYYDRFGLSKYLSESEQQIDDIVKQLNEKYNDGSLTRDDVRRMTDSLDELMGHTTTH